MKETKMGSSSKRYRLPKPHLSWSAVDLVERDPIEYTRAYILGEPRYESEAMLFGKKFATAMEQGKPDQDDTEAMKFLVQIGIPRLEMVEHRMEIEVGGIPFIIVLDTVAADLKRFREYKTGMQPWDQRKVDSHGQLVLYGLGLYLATKQMPECHLDWIRTHYDPVSGELTADGTWQTFKRKPFTLVEFGAMTNRVVRAAEKIDALMREQGKA